MRCNVLCLSLVVAMAGVLTSGCTQAPPETPKTPAATAKDGEEPAAHKHDHGAPGKHGGPQQLLGNHEYHVELTHNEDSGEVAVYVTDADLKPVEVPEKTVFLTAVVDGKSKEFTLNGENPAGGQPRFVVVDKQLAEIICDGKGGVRLNAKIKGKPYAATYDAAAHGDHDHEHGDKHDHEKEAPHK